MALPTDEETARICWEQAKPGAKASKGHKPPSPSECIVEGCARADVPAGHAYCVDHRGGIPYDQPLTFEQYERGFPVEPGTYDPGPCGPECFGGDEYRDETLEAAAYDMAASGPPLSVTPSQPLTIRGSERAERVRVVIQYGPKRTRQP